MSIEVPTSSPPSQDVGATVTEVLADALVALLRERPRDISLTAASVLGTLDRQGATRLGDLAAAEGVAQPSMSALVAHLEKLGLVERRSDPSDRRGVLVAITPDGLRSRAERRRSLSTRVRQVVDQLDREDRAALTTALPALRRLVSGLQTPKGSS